MSHNKRKLEQSNDDDEKGIIREEYAKELHYQILQRLKLSETLRRILEIYNKLVRLNRQPKISTILCGISDDCLSSLGRCQKLHGENYLPDLLKILEIFEEDIEIIAFNVCVNIKELSLSALDKYTIIFKSNNRMNHKILSKSVMDKLSSKLIDYLSKESINTNLVSLNNNRLSENNEIKKSSLKIRSKSEILINEKESLEISSEDEILHIKKRVQQIDNFNSDDLDRPHSIEEVANFIANSNILNGKICYRKIEEKKEPVYCESNDDIYNILHEQTLIALEKFINTGKDSKTINKRFKFYIHQSKAIKSILIDRKHTILSTSTSSGKSLCYIIPAIEYYLEDPKSITLILFPTKALAQNQFNSISILISYFLEKPVLGMLDGDTEKNKRFDIVTKSNIILSNIDFIHWNIDFIASSIYDKLRLFVMDEVHVYNGQYGSNASLVIRRFWRSITYFLQKTVEISTINSEFNINNKSFPIYVSCSATIFNPLQHFNTLTGISSYSIKGYETSKSEQNNERTDDNISNTLNNVQNITLIEEDYSLASKCLTIIWDSNIFNVTNSQVVKPQCNSIRSNSNYKECLNLLLELYFLNKSTLVFCKKRKQAEMMRNDLQNLISKIENIKSKDQKGSISKFSSDLKDSYNDSNQDYMDLEKLNEINSEHVYNIFDKATKYSKLSDNCRNKIITYRGGLPVQKRRELESLLFEGKVKIVFCTSALELGIDIQSIHCVLTYGFPDSINRLKQQFGRCGRNPNIEGLRILFLEENSPIDLYWRDHGDELLSKPNEPCIINPYNPLLLILHIACCTNEAYKNFQINRDKLYFGSHIIELLLEIIDVLRIRGEIKILKNHFYLENKVTDIYKGEKQTELDFDFYCKNLDDKVTDLNNCSIYHTNKTNISNIEGLPCKNYSCIKYAINLFWVYDWDLVGSKCNHFQFDKYINKSINLNLFSLLLTKQDTVIKSLVDVYQRTSIRGGEFEVFIYNEENKLIDKLPIITCIWNAHPGAIHYVNGISYEIETLDIRNRRGTAIRYKPEDLRSYKTVSDGEVSMEMFGEGIRYTTQNKINFYFALSRVTNAVYSFTTKEFINNQWQYIKERYLKSPVQYSFNTFGLQIRFRLDSLIDIHELNKGIHSCTHIIMNTFPLVSTHFPILDLECECPDIYISSGKNRQSDVVTLLFYENKINGNGCLSQIIGLNSQSTNGEADTYTGKINIEVIANKALENLLSCICENGCFKCGMYINTCKKKNKHFNKKISIEILKILSIGANNNSEIFRDIK
ncbi:DEAD DEAH box helicase family protein [Cryptosporidium andersoni]|uniref:DEAD DEAH box helicase family protein n=1 Tax=Cryptosporidium andersoni TaxID=117008 RepID=A0A1J4MUW8_9CRYT|nr:DEAD DEAH box helicase family protein [Cryptosporidium andersoni]